MYGLSPPQTWKGQDALRVQNKLFSRATRCFLTPPTPPRPYLLHVLTVQIFGSCHSSQVVGLCRRLNRKWRSENGRRSRMAPSVYGDRPAALTLGEAVPPPDRSLYKPVGKTKTTTSHRCSLRLLPVARKNSKTWLHDLEVLQEISAGDFVASDFLFHQLLWSQEERHQLGQPRLKIPVDV